MDRLSKKEKEFKEIIEQQKEQLIRYEKKLRDVVQAYKGIQKEKEALEASLSILTTSTPSTSATTTDYQENDEINNESTSSGGGTSASVSSPSGDLINKQNQPTNDQQDVIKQLRAQLSTLSASLSTISSEKSRIEAQFQADRKRLLTEKDDLEKSLAAACSQAESATQSLKQQLTEVKSSLTSEKTERSRESANNQVIYRELQKTISEERQKREAVEMELSTKTSRLSQSFATSHQLEIAERKIRDLSNELEATKIKLRASEEKLDQPSPHLVQLQNEMADLKIQHRLAIQQEQRNAAEAKESARLLDEAHEKRVASLEARLAEFSERIGAYDRLRQQDLSTVAKLKEQLNSIQYENYPSSINNQEEEYDVDKIVDKMRSLKSKLLQLGRGSTTVNNLATLLELDLVNSDHEVCQLELQQLKKELEWFKQKEQRSGRKEMIRSGPTEDEVNQLRVQIQFLRSEMEHSEQEHRESLKAVQDSWMKERLTWKDELTQAERAGRNRVADLELQLQKQRERSLTLLQEKDEELNSLREWLNMKNATPLSSDTRSTERNKAEADGEEWPESLAQLGSMTLGASASGGQILHYVEELARKEVEIQGLRRSRNQLEASLRDMQMASVAMEHKVAEQKQHLHEELARLERNQSREGANLEYLKNVLLEFFLRSDPSSQAHMFNAIAACLHFSPKEIQRVRQKYPNWKLSSVASPPGVGREGGW